MRFDLNKGFPLLTTRKMFLTGAIDELIWFISGSTNAYDLPERTQHWWTPWADEYGDLGPIYGEQYRRARWADEDGYVTEVDQLASVIESIQTNPSSRRHVINLWNTPALLHARLPCCHGSTVQFYVAEGRLSCHMTQRSCDLVLGFPSNIASYALLTMMIAQVCGLNLGELIWTGGDVHLYANHLDQADLQLTREPLPLPEMLLNKEVKDIFSFKFEDFELVNYQHHPAIKAPVAV